MATPSVFDNKQIESDIISKLNDKTIKKTQYYATVNNKTVNISDTKPDPEPAYSSLYEIIPENATFKIVKLNNSNSQYASFYVIETDGTIASITDLDNYGVGANKYVFPSLTAAEVDGIPKEVIGGRKGIPNSGTSCYINAMLQMLFDIPEFKTYILNATEETQKNEADEYVLAIDTAKKDIVVEIFNNPTNDTTITANQKNIQEFFIFIYNFIVGNEPDGNNNDDKISNVLEYFIANPQNIPVAIQMLNFTKSANGDLTSEFSIFNGTAQIKKKMSQVDIDKYNMFEINFNNNYVFTVIISNLNNIIKYKTNLANLVTKYKIIENLKQVFNFIDGTTEVLNITNIVTGIQDQLGFGVRQDDAAEVYNRLAKFFEDELTNKYGLEYRGNIQSPYNVQNDPNKNNLAEFIVTENPTLVNNDQLNVLIGYTDDNPIEVSQEITIQKVPFTLVGFLVHQGQLRSISSSQIAIGATGGHYVYYNIKDRKFFNDSVVEDIADFNATINNKNKFVALYERKPNSTTGGANNVSTSSLADLSEYSLDNILLKSGEKINKKFRVSRRKSRKSK